MEKDIRKRVDKLENWFRNHSENHPDWMSNKEDYWTLLDTIRKTV